MFTMCSFVNLYEIFANKMKHRTFDIENEGNGYEREKSDLLDVTASDWIYSAISVRIFSFLEQWRN